MVQAMRCAGCYFSSEAKDLPTVKRGKHTEEVEYWLDQILRTKPQGAASMVLHSAIWVVQLLTALLLCSLELQKCEPSSLALRGCRAMTRSGEPDVGATA